FNSGRAELALFHGREPPWLEARGYGIAGGGGMPGGRERQAGPTGQRKRAPEVRRPDSSCVFLVLPARADRDAHDARVLGEHVGEQGRGWVGQIDARRIVLV